MSMMYGYREIGTKGGLLQFFATAYPLTGDRKVAIHEESEAIGGSPARIYRRQR